MKSIVALCFLLAIATSSIAHELQAAALRVEESSSGFVRATLKTPLARDGGSVGLVPRFPLGCEPVGEPRTERRSEVILREWAMRCDRTLAGREIRLEGLDPRMPDALVSVSFGDGRTTTAAVNRQEPAVRVELAPGAPAVLAFLRIGVEHILLGVDHLLFVLGLLLVVQAAGRGLGTLVAALSAFTLAHSLTLALAVLGIWGLPAKPVEILIALSIVLVAHELAIHDDRRAPSLTFRHPWLVAFAFGLLHGFGFAGALAEVGLPEHARASALLLFNLGVELGQLAFVSAIMLSWALLRLVPRPAFAGNGANAMATLLGGVATYWTLDRLLRWSTAVWPLV